MPKAITIVNIKDELTRISKIPNATYDDGSGDGNTLESAIPFEYLQKIMSQQTERIVTAMTEDNWPVHLLDFYSVLERFGNIVGQPIRSVYVTTDEKGCPCGKC